VAVVDPERCVGCLTCVRICPYGVPKISNTRAGVGNLMGAAYIEPSVCHGCGTCVSECPAQAIQLMHYTDIQTESKIDALFGRGSMGYVPVAGVEVLSQTVDEQVN
jgi:heterodisulfide reductase subunit A-like polyferredoxin